jgi:hypothetical protein
MHHVSLGDALAFTALVALRDRPRSRRVAVRWLRRWLDENPEAGVDQVATVAALLAALGGLEHHWALGCLRDLGA